MDYQNDFAKWMRREASDDFRKGGLNRVEDAYRDGWRAGWVARQSTRQDVPETLDTTELPF